MTEVLLQIFLNPYQSSELTLDDGLVHAIVNHPNSNALIFGSKYKSKTEPKKVKTVILMLLECGILTHKIIYNVEDENKRNPIVLASMVVTQVDGESTIAVHDKNRWWDILLK